MPWAPACSRSACAARPTTWDRCATWSHGETRAGSPERARYRAPVSDLTTPTSAPLDSPTLLVTISGDDRPGVSSALFDAIADVGAEVLDLEQVVVRGHLTLAMLLAPGAGAEERLTAVVGDVAGQLGLTARFEAGTGDNAGASWAILAAWAIVMPLTAARTFKWD